MDISSNLIVDDARYRKWKRVDDMMHSWLLNCIYDDVFDAFMFCKSTKEVWIDLKERFKESDGE